MVRVWLKRGAMWLGGAAVVAILVFAFVPKPISVDVAPIERGLLRVTVDEDGKTRIRERYVVSAPLAGRSQRIFLKPGDPVIPGQTVLTIIEPTDPALLDARGRLEAEARVRAAEASRKRAEANLARAESAAQFAQREYERARQLSIGRGIAQQDLEDLAWKERAARDDLRAAELGVDIAQFELELAQAALARTKPMSPGEEDQWRIEMRAPVPGKVLNVFQESSAVVPSGHQLLEIGDPTDLEIEIDVLSQDAVKVTPGDKVLLEHWGGGEPLWGRVRLIEPAGFTKISALGVEEQRVNVIVDFADPPEMRPALGHGYRVEARIIIWEGPDVLKVPSSALFRHDDGWAVFVIEAGKARRRLVRIGRQNGLEAEVVAGLHEGEIVIVHPSDKIHDGGKVAPR
ncbi:MAG: efflux RND transporter periplasmic adaptor subunit [Gemmataceae bacterium]